MRGKKTTELEQLETGLGSAEDPLNLKDLLTRTIEDLAEHVDSRIRYTALDMVDQGRYFHAIKEKCAHGTWEPFVQKRKWSWHYVHCCMKLVVVVAEFPQALHLPPGRATDKLLQLPPPAIAEILKDLSPQTIEKLTPWDLEHAHYDYLKEKAAQKRAAKPGKKLSEEEIARVMAEQAEKDWVEFATTFEEARGALVRLARVKIQPHWFERIFERKMVERFSEAWGELVEKMHPIEEIQKREHVVHAPGFAD